MSAHYHTVFRTLAVLAAVFGLSGALLSLGARRHAGLAWTPGLRDGLLSSALVTGLSLALLAGYFYLLR